MIDDDDDAALLSALPSDFDAALQRLFSQVPRGARLCGGSLAVVPVSQMYSLLDDRAEVDCALERQRVAGTLHIIALPNTLREERLLVRTDEYAAALRTAAAATGDDATSLEAAVRLLSRGGGAAVRISSLEAAVTSISADATAQAMVRLGWLTPHRQLHRGGPGEAPEVEGSAWLWSLPRCGVLMEALLQAPAYRRAAHLPTLTTHLASASRHAASSSARCAGSGSAAPSGMSSKGRRAPRCARRAWSSRTSCATWPAAACCGCRTRRQGPSCSSHRQASRRRA